MTRFGDIKRFNACWCNCLESAQAIVATAHKMTWKVYHMVKFKIVYQTMTANEYEQRYWESEIRARLPVWELLYFQQRPLYRLFLSRRSTPRELSTAS